MKTRRIARGRERTFSKSGRMKRTFKQIYQSTRTLSATTIVTVLNIQKFSNFALYVINK